MANNTQYYSWREANLALVRVGHQLDKQLLKMADVVKYGPFPKQEDAPAVHEAMQRLEQARFLLMGNSRVIYKKKI